MHYVDLRPYPLGKHLTGKFGLDLIVHHEHGSSIEQQLFFADRTFESRSEAFTYAAGWAKKRGLLGVDHERLYR